MLLYGIISDDKTLNNNMTCQCRPSYTGCSWVQHTMQTNMYYYYYYYYYAVDTHVKSFTK